MAELFNISGVIKATCAEGEGGSVVKQRVCVKCARVCVRRGVRGFGLPVAHLLHMEPEGQRREMRHRVYWWLCVCLWEGRCVLRCGCTLPSCRVDLIGISRLWHVDICECIDIHLVWRTCGGVLVGVGATACGRTLH